MMAVLDFFKHNPGFLMPLMMVMIGVGTEILWWIGKHD